MTYKEFLEQVLATLSDKCEFLCNAAEAVECACNAEKGSEEFAQLKAHRSKFQARIDSLLLAERNLRNAEFTPCILVHVLVRKYGVWGLTGREMLLRDMIEEAKREEDDLQ